MLLAYYSDMNAEQIADEIGTSSGQVQRWLTRPGRKLSGHAQLFRDEFDSLDQALRYMNGSALLEDLLRVALMESAQAPKNKCPECSNSLPACGAIAQVGRPRRYCSNACRQRAYRRRARPPGWQPH